MNDTLRIAIIVNPALSPGFLANTVGAIGIGLGARLPQLAASQLSDACGRTIDVSANRPVPILQAKEATLRSTMLKALQQTQERAVVPFPAFARKLHAFTDYAAALPTHDLTDVEIDGLGIAGPGDWVKSLTGSLGLLR